MHPSLNFPVYIVGPAPEVNTQMHLNKKVTSHMCQREAIMNYYKIRPSVKCISSSVFSRFSLVCMCSVNMDDDVMYFYGGVGWIEIFSDAELEG